MEDTEVAPYTKKGKGKGKAEGLAKVQGQGKGSKKGQEASQGVVMAKDRPGEGVLPPEGPPAKRIKVEPVDEEDPAGEGEKTQKKKLQDKLCIRGERHCQELCRKVRALAMLTSQLASALAGSRTRMGPRLMTQAARL